MRTVLLLLALPMMVVAADWPTYKADAARSGIAREELNLPLKEAWVHRSPHKPRPAWRAPAREDLYNGKGQRLHNRQTFDHAYHAISVGNLIFYGSSADDQVYCLDAKTGRVRWTYFTEGPIRLAPTFHEDKLYVGSDDGHVYCLGPDGKLLWKTSLAPKNYRIAGNGRIISAWPVRSGVLVDKGIAYAAAGMFPSEGVHIYALDEVTGDIKWRSKKQTDVPAQGYLLMSENNLYVPAGRDNPVVYERVSGKRLRKLGGKGGTDVTMYGDAVFTGPGRTGQIGLVLPGQTKVFYTFFGMPSQQRTQMVVTPERFYVGGAGELRAMNHPEFLKQEKDRQETSGRIGKLNEHIKNARRGKPTPKPLPDLQKELDKEKMHMEIVLANIKKCHLWKAPSEFSDALILAGDTLFVGGDNVVRAHRVQDGREVWRHAVSGRALGLSVANGHLLVSTDQGVIHNFAAKSVQ